MSIFFDENERLFHLQSDTSSYIIKVYPAGLLGNVYWGPRLANRELACLPRLRARGDVQDFEGVEDTLHAEYPGWGTSDFRTPAFQVRYPNGSLVSRLRYAGHRVQAGKIVPEGLPGLWCSVPDEADTLIITLDDRLTQGNPGENASGTRTGLLVELSYTMFRETGALVRSARFINNGGKPLSLLRAMSMTIDVLPDDFEVIHLTGSWARERSIIRQPLKGGAVTVESVRGISSHQANPFIALAQTGVTEETGLVYGCSLVYSGNFIAQAELEQYGSARLLMGVNPQGFSWNLEQGESFQTPECVMVCSGSGLGGMSRAFHRLYRNNLIRGLWAHRERPILVNNWEATYFNFNAEKILNIAAEASGLGIELMVLDDGWFGHRDADNSSLGDWYEDRHKLPAGLKALAEGVREKGVMFGLWFEPEMISPDSDLYRTHPDWCLHVPSRWRTEIRNQLVLDLCREEVRDAVVEMVSAILREVPISYVKWDMNRPLTEVFSPVLPAGRQGEVFHRYALGVYDLMERITSAFPQVLFEGCAGGGARFDPGVLYYMPQIWTSDNSDAIDRLKIQYGTSLVYPVSAMGAHVSAVPNHQNGRVTPLDTRGNVAMSGAFGYEMDLGVLTEDEKAAVREQVAFYKEHRGLMQNGDLYRLKSPFEGNEAAWIIVSGDKRRALLMYARVLGGANGPLQNLRLAGLDPEAVYQAKGATIYRAGGDALMRAGLPLPQLRGDFQSCVWILEGQRG